MLGLVKSAEKQPLSDTELPTAETLQVLLGKDALAIETLPKDIVEGKSTLMYPFAGIRSGRVAVNV